MISSLCAHENTVYAVAYSKDGKKFASGGADCGVIVWNSKAQPVIKYHHTTSVQCLDFNPVSHVLASGSGTDYGLWS